MVRNISSVNSYILTIFRNITYLIRIIKGIKRIIIDTKRNIPHKTKILSTQQKSETNNLHKTPSANKGLAIAGGTSSVHVLCFGRNLYFS